MSSNFFVTDPCDYREPVVGDSVGFDSQQPLTVIEVFQEISRLHGDRPALAFKRKNSEVDTICYCYGLLYDCSYLTGPSSTRVHHYQLRTILGFVHAVCEVADQT